jgi:branched-chain amino acid transport system permease protein
MNSLKQNFKIILRYGLLGGIVAFYIASIGVVEVFSERSLVAGVITLGQIFLITGSIGAGMFTAKTLKGQKTSDVYLASFLSGAIASIFLIALTFIIQIFVVQVNGKEVFFYLRDMFVHYSPKLLEIITFGKGLLLGNLLFLLFSAVMGIVGASFVVLPERWRNAWTNSLLWVLLLGLFSENVAQIVRETFGAGLNRILFSQKALNLPAASVIFLLAFLSGYLELNRSVRAKWTAMPEEKQKKGNTILVVLGVVFLLSLPWIVGLFLSQAVFMIGLYVMMGLGLNIVVGYAGLLDLGYVAFFAFGAYTMGILTSTGDLGRAHMSFWAALPFAMLAGTLWGLLLGFPVLRMRGDYLAIVTLGFGEIIRILALSNWLAPFEGGAQGVLHIPYPSIFGYSLDTPQTMYYLVVLGALLAAFVTIRLRDSRLGRQWMAMREDEDVAEAMGINLVSTKLLAFSIGASFSALAGAIFAARLGNIFPHSFNILISINALSLIIVGGIGSIPGVVVGALILVGLPEMLREFEDYRLLMYGILLIVMMLVKPEGFWPEERRKMELHANDEIFDSPQPEAEAADE